MSCHHNHNKLVKSVTRDKVLYTFRCKFLYSYDRWPAFQKVKAIYYFQKQQTCLLTFKWPAYRNNDLCG